MLTYSADLDPSGFTGDTDQALLRGIRATTAMKLSLVFGERIPVLAQNQVFDSPLMFGLLSPGGEASADAEKVAFLWLVQNDYIQVRIHEAGLKETNRPEDRFTLRNACASALANPKFTLSAWPDLDIEQRQQTARYLTGESDGQPPSAYQDRATVIQQLDDALQASKASEKAVVIKDSLVRFIRDELQQRRGDRPGSYLVPWFDKLGQFAQSVKDSTVELDGEPIKKFDQNMRSEWRRLILTYRIVNGHPENHGPLAAASALVDLAYNRKVAQSMGAPYQLEVATQEVQQELIKEDPDTISMHWESTFLTSETQGDWLSWSYVQSKLEAGDVPNEQTQDGQARRQVILRELCEMKVRQEVSGGFVLSGHAKIASLARDVGIGAGAIIGNLGGTVLLSHPVGAVGVVAGALIGDRVGSHLEPLLVGRQVKRQIESLNAELRTGKAGNA